MNRSRLLWEITRWELLRWFKIKDLLRTLVISSVLGLSVWGGLAAFDHYEGGSVRIAILDREVLPFELSGSGDLVIDESPWASEAEAIEALEQGEIDALLRLDDIDRGHLMVSREPLWIGELEMALSHARRRLELERSGVDEARLADLEAGVELATVYHEGASLPTSLERKVTAGILVSLMILGVFTGIAYQFIVITGEKQLRVTEQVVSAITPQMWIDGKILGISLLAFLTTATYIVSGLIFAMISKLFGRDLGLPLELADFGFWAQVSLLALGGFLMWNTFFGLIAATIDDPNTSSRGSLMLLPIVPLVFAYFGLSRPDSAWIQVLSILPPTSPTILTLRLALTEVPLWEVALALVLLAAATWSLRRAAGKVFALGILMHGKEPSWKETMRWIREA